MKEDDLYARLGVPRDADSAAINAAFRDRAKSAHPDAGGSDEEFQDLKSAHLVLTNPQRRANYDRSGDPGESVDNTEARARQLIAQMLQGVIVGEPDPDSFDVAEAMKDKTGREIVELNQTIASTKRAAKRAEKMRQRLKGKKGKPILDAILVAHLSSMNRAIAAAEEKIADRRRVLDILRDVRFEADWGSSFDCTQTFRAETIFNSGPLS